MQYEVFEVWIKEGPQGEYPVEVTSPIGKASGLFKIPFSEEELRRTLLDIDRFSDRATPDSIRAFGEKLFGAVFAGEIYDLYIKNRQTLGARPDKGPDKGLRIKLRVDPPAIAILPWETIYDSQNQVYVGLGQRTTLTRYIEPKLSGDQSQLSLVPPWKMLVVISCPMDGRVVPFDTWRQMNAVKEALDSLEQDGMVKIDFLMPGEATKDNLFNQLVTGGFHVLYYVGHGEFDEENNRGAIILEDGAGNCSHLDADGLKLLLDGTAIRLVVLNACNSARFASRLGDVTDTRAGIGVAQSLSAMGIPFVVAMQFEMPVNAALIFSKSFFTALAGGLPIDACVAKARAMLLIQHRQDIDCIIPTCFMIPSDGIPFILQEPKRRATEAEVKTEEVPPKDMILVPGGEFIKGLVREDVIDMIMRFGLGPDSLEALLQNQREKINLPDFYIDKHLVTNEQYKRFVLETSHPKPPHWNQSEPFFPDEESNHPVVNVTWQDAAAYCRWAGKRLPSDFEWEKAARGTDGKLYPWGNEYDIKKCNTAESGNYSTTPVGKYEGGKSPYGAYDMTGNVAEWTGSGTSDYKIVKGGSWRQTCEVYGLAAFSLRADPRLIRDDIGFRCAKDA